MNKGRLEAFTDGVIAIIITILVLEIKIPHGESFSDLIPLYPIFISYILSFLYIGITWNNHHHTMQAVESVSGKVLWSNLNLLFWLSLLPFTTGWMGENHFAKEPTLLYGLNLLLSAFAYYLWILTLARHHGKSSKFTQALNNDKKEKITMLTCILGITLTFINPIWGLIVFFGVALIWLIPDKRMEKIINPKE